MMEHFDTLFLDRDGVINRLLPGDYVKRWDEFRFLDGALEAFPLLGRCFRRIVVVTNQRGVGRGAMSRGDLDDIHDRMLCSITECGGRIDRIYSCTDTDEESPRRKPRPGWPGSCSFSAGGNLFGHGERFRTKQRIWKNRTSE